MDTAALFSTWRRVNPVGWLLAARRAITARVRDGRELASGHSAVARPTEVGRVVSIARKHAHRAPMELLEEGQITAERGLEGNVSGRPGRRQITVVAREGWADACRDLGRDVPWTTRRANLLVEGLGVARRVGARLEMGQVLLEITGETTPCTRMEEQVAGLAAALERDWRAGVTCRVLRGGTVRVGDVARLAEPAD